VPVMSSDVLMGCVCSAIDGYSQNNKNLQQGQSFSFLIPSLLFLVFFQTLDIYVHQSVETENVQILGSLLNFGSTAVDEINLPLTVIVITFSKLSQYSISPYARTLRILVPTTEISKVSIHAISQRRPESQNTMSDLEQDLRKKNRQHTNDPKK